MGGLGPYDARPALRDRAAQLAMTVPHVLSHDSAARAHGLPMLRPRGPSSVTSRAPAWAARAPAFGVKHHLSQAMPPIVERRRTPRHGLARVALDLGREHGFDAGVVACDGVLRRGVTRAELETDARGHVVLAEHHAVARSGRVRRSGRRVRRGVPGSDPAGRARTRPGGDPVRRPACPRARSGATCGSAAHVFEFDGRGEVPPRRRRAAWPIVPPTRSSGRRRSASG